MISAFPCLQCGERHAMSAAAAHGADVQPVQLCPKTGKPITTPRDCWNYSHPMHTGVCGYVLTETVRDDVGWFAPPSGAVITEIVGTCRCLGLPR